MAAGVPYGEYQLVRRIGAGAMAEVFLARRVGQRGFEKQLVIKRLMPHLCAQERFAEMFVNEARLAALIDHPNLAHVSDFGEVAGTFFLAMEYVEGLTLGDFLEHVGRVGPGVAARVAIDLLEALHAIHAARNLEGQPLHLVHRDVSTRNTMIRVDGVVKLLDFGIAVATEAARQGDRMGTRGFMSPEQLEGKALDARSDLYSVGVLIYRMVTGEMPPESAERELVLDAVPEGLARVVRAALSSEREARPASAREMQATLESFAGECGAEATRAHLAVLVSGAKRQASAAGRNGEVAGARKTRVTRLTKLTQVPEDTAPGNALQSAAVDDVAAPALRRPRAKMGAGSVIVWSLLGLSAGAIVAAGVLQSKRPDVVSVVLPIESLTAPATARSTEPAPAPADIEASSSSRTPASAELNSAKSAPADAERDPASDQPKPAPAEAPKPAASAAPRTRPKGFGALAIDTNPWTEVFLDGRSLGTTPLEKSNLPSGAHELELRNPTQGIKKRIRVVIRPGESTHVYRELTP